MNDQITITCPSCGAPMVERENRQNGSRFLGCTRYPNCDHTEKIPPYLEMKRSGAMELPGLETS